MKRMIGLGLALFFCVATVNAQKPTLTQEEVTSYETQIQQMVNYLQETLNFIGDSTSTAKEKETVFNDSYSKIFADDKVQIEDDLDDSRLTPINKDVQAYLKDIDFFFDYAIFSFDIQNIANLAKDDGTVFFKVTLTRKLDGKTITGETVSTVKNRFIEINLDRQNNDLKIASIYTTKLNEKEELRLWWNSLSYDWKQCLGKEIMVNDSLCMQNVMTINETNILVLKPNGTESTINGGIDNIYNKLKSVTQRQSVSLTGHNFIETLEPLSELSDLIALNISGIPIEDLAPLRNANKLKSLIANGTKIDDISALKYDIALKELNIADTYVSDLSTLANLTKLEKLNISNTMVTSLEDVTNCPGLTHLFAGGSKISDISAVDRLQNLINLDISNTTVRDITPLKNLKVLQSLNISGTPLVDISILSETENLKEVSFSNTSIKDLSPLKSHQNLTRIYCDNSRVDVAEASDFTKENPYTLVIYDTEALNIWWNNLPIYWKAVFSQQCKLSATPSTEELHQIINMKELDLSDNEYMQDLIPVSRLTNLESLNIANTEITNLEPLRGMSNLQNINLEKTFVNSLSPLENMSSLKSLDIVETQISDLSALTEDSNIDIILADNTAITTSQVVALKSKQPQVTVIYQTENLNQWWGNLNDNWKEIMRTHVPYNSVNPSSLELQKMVDLRNIDITSRTPVVTLEPIRNFLWIEVLSAANQSITDLSPIANKYQLKELYLQNNPLTNLEALATDEALEVLNVENTQIKDLTCVIRMQHLRVLNASGTGIKSLKPLSNLTELEELLINNTSVRNLSALENITSLKSLKVYNTRVKAKTIESLQQKRLDLNIVYY